jgi:hypothetical protein
MMASSLPLLQPIFSCWFNTYENQKRVINLVFSYNNTWEDIIVLKVDNQHIETKTTDKNYIEPSIYSIYQPDVFKTGYNEFAFVIKDDKQYLSTTGSSIIWYLQESSTIVNHHDVYETNEHQCRNKFNGACPMRIDHFCEDSSYCNGLEPCFSSSLSGLRLMNTITDPRGNCDVSSKPIPCQDEQVCSDEEMKCIAIVKPTPAPTSSPTQAPTSTPAPTSAPTEKEMEGECDEHHQDCRRCDTYCDGPYKCDIKNHKCVQSIENYSPCAEKYTNKNAMVIITCIERLSLCVETLNCTLHSDCNNGLYCDGTELCINNVCVYQQDQSPLAICGVENAVCTEETHCYFINQHFSHGSIVAVCVMASAFLGIIIIIIAIYLYYIDQKKNVQSNNKSL